MDFLLRVFGGGREKEERGRGTYKGLEKFKGLKGLWKLRVYGVYKGLNDFIEFCRTFWVFWEF